MLLVAGSRDVNARTQVGLKHVREYFEAYVTDESCIARKLSLSTRLLRQGELAIQVQIQLQDVYPWFAQKSELPALGVLSN
jgi:hypothetical protein